MVIYELLMRTIWNKFEGEGGKKALQESPPRLLNSSHVNIVKLVRTRYAV